MSDLHGWAYMEIWHPPCWLCNGTTILAYCYFRMPVLVNLGELKLLIQLASIDHVLKKPDWIQFRVLVNMLFLHVGHLWLDYWTWSPD